MTKTVRGRSAAGPAAALALVVLLLLVSVPRGAAESALVVGAPSGATGAPNAYGPAVPVGSFAERAGYVPSQLPGPAPSRPSTGSATILLTFRPSDPSFFVPPAAGTPGLSTAAIAERFGLSVTQYAAFEQYFRAQGLETVGSTDRLALTVSGPVAALGHAFGTVLDNATWDARSVRFPVSPPTLPASLEPEVASVLGLRSGFASFVTPSLRPSLASSVVGPSVPGSGNLVTPAIARSIYGLSSLYNVSGSAQYASSQKLAVLLWGPGYSPADLTTFFNQEYPSGFPKPSITPVPVSGAPGPSPSAVNDPCGAAEELTLDLEWSGSMAPGATLYAVYAPESAAPTCSPSSIDMATALHAALGLPVDAISMSFGTPESTDASLQAAWQTYLAEASQRGITLLAATGDLGGDAKPNCQGGPAPMYPATSPDVLAVGGTDVLLTRNFLGEVVGHSEIAWNGSGGGFSTQFTAPSWQSLGNSYRGTPDVAATAAYNYVYFNGASMTAGGTSFATPLWAGLITEMDAIYGRSLGFLTPNLYALASQTLPAGTTPGFTDITSGSTCLPGSATTGWDPETGWGSPNALVLYEQLTATFVDLGIRATPSAVGPGGSVTILVHLANRTSGAPITGVPVRIALVATSTLGPCVGTFGSADPSTDAEGNVSVSVTVPLCYLGSHASAQALVVTNGLYGTNTTTVSVNLLALVPLLGALSEYPYNLLGFVLIMAVASAAGYAIGRPRRRVQASTSSPSTVSPRSGGVAETSSPASPAASAAPDGSPGAPEVASGATLAAPVPTPSTSSPVAEPPASGLPAPDSPEQKP